MDVRETNKELETGLYSEIAKQKRSGVHWSEHLFELVKKETILTSIPKCYRKSCTENKMFL